MEHFGVAIQDFATNFTTNTINHFSELMKMRVMRRAMSRVMSRAMMRVKLRQGPLSPKVSRSTHGLWHATHFMRNHGR
jgi:methylmalonyl-CoA mutase N-terminal domain/subunit